MRIRCELSRWEKLVLNVRVGDNDDRSVRADKSSLQAEGWVQSHRRSLGRQGEGRRENLQMMRRFAESNRSLQEKDHQGGDQFHEYDVLNIQMIVERQ